MHTRVSRGIRGERRPTWKKEEHDSPRTYLDLQPSEKENFEAQSCDWALCSCSHDQMHTGSEICSKPLAGSRPFFVASCRPKMVSFSKMLHVPAACAKGEDYASPVKHSCEIFFAQTWCSPLCSGLIF